MNIMENIKPDKSTFQRLTDKYSTYLETQALSDPSKLDLHHIVTWIVVWLIVLKTCLLTYPLDDNTSVENIFGIIAATVGCCCWNAFFSGVQFETIISSVCQTRKNLSDSRDRFLCSWVLSTFGQMLSLLFLYLFFQGTGNGYLTVIFVPFAFFECIINPITARRMIGNLICLCDACKEYAENTISYRSVSKPFKTCTTITVKELRAEFPLLPKQIIFVCDKKMNPLHVLESDTSKFSHDGGKLYLKTSADF